MSGRVLSDQAGQASPGANELSPPSGDHPSRKVVINVCHGGFGLSREGVLSYARHAGLTLYVEDPSGNLAILDEPTYWLVPPDLRPPSQDAWQSWTLEERAESNRLHKEAELTPRDIARDDPALVAAVEELGDKAASRYAKFKVVAIPADAEWQIDEYDGWEWIAEKHRTWS